ncbi:uncharacterized protein V6R79_013183 [Siganus canaliculatus]
MRRLTTLRAAALRDMTTKPSEQLFPGMDDRSVKRSATNDKPIPRRVESEEK